MLHYLRIAVTALSLTACVLLVALWVRSYRKFEWVVIGVPGAHLRIVSYPAALQIMKEQFFVDKQLAQSPWQIHGRPRHPSVTGYYLPRITKGQWPFLSEAVMIVPYWVLLSFAALLAALPWIRQLGRRFGLRTLLIATTLVAVGLAVIVAAM
jgi:hypothetical protein